MWISGIGCTLLEGHPYGHAVRRTANGLIEGVAVAVLVGLAHVEISVVALVSGISRACIQSACGYGAVGNGAKYLKGPQQGSLLAGGTRTYSVCLEYERIVGGKIANYGVAV